MNPANIARISLLGWGLVLLAVVLEMAGDCECHKAAEAPQAEPVADHG